jgi:hypothetical protein
MIDNEPIGHHYQALFPFIPHLETEKCPHKEYFDLQGQAVGFCCELAENEMTGTGVKGHNSNILHNSFRIQNRRTGAGVKVSSDKPAVSIYMCAGRRFFSVEPQIEILARTGEEFKWANTYEFYT